MKKLNFLSKVCGLSRASQYCDVGIDRRLTVGSLSGLHRLTKYIAVMFLLLVVGVGNAWGASDAVYTVSGKTSVTSSGTNPSGSSASYSQDYATAKQLTNAAPNATLTLSGYDGKKITGLKLNMKNSNSKTAQIKVTIGDVQVANVAALSLSTTYTDKTITISPQRIVHSNEKIVITIKASGSSVYIDHFTVTWETPTSRTVTFNTGTGNPSLSNRSGAYITLPSTSDLTPACSGDGWALYGWATATYGSSSTTTAPTSTLAGLAGAEYEPSSNVTLYAVYRKLTGSSSSVKTTYTINGNWTSDNGNWTKVDGSDLANLASGKWGINSGSSTAVSPVSYNAVTGITFTGTKSSSGAGTVAFYYGSGNSWTLIESKSFATSLSWSPSSVAGQLKIVLTRTNGNLYVASIDVTSTEPSYYYWSAPTCAACSSNASIGNATLNGAVSLSSVPFSCTVSSEGGTGCSISDAGFVWKSGSDPSASDNKTAGTFSTNITGTIPSAGSFSLGTTYYVKAYATNGNGTVLSGTSYQYRVQSVTFNGNTSTSGSMNTQYVEYNKSTALTSNAFSKTGHTFAGWATAADGNVVYSNGQSVSATGNLSLYAKWTANNYTITLNQDLTPTSTGTTSITATYNSSSNLTSAITKPTKDGWTFAGYFTAKNGGGTQIIDANGNVIASAGGGSTYTDASKNWKYVGNITLYAKWTCTATWSVNGNTSVYAAQTITYNSSGCKVSSVPAPDPASYCGQSFAGWTTSAINRPQDSAPATLFKTVGDSPELKTVGNQTFYAVFADYTTD